MLSRHGASHAAKPKPRYEDMVYELHRRQQLDSFLEILLPFAAEDMYVRQTHLYNSFVALCADTPMSYEAGDWYNDTQSAWEAYIWGLMKTKINAYIVDAEFLSPEVSDWKGQFKFCLTVLCNSIRHYQHCITMPEEEDIRIAKLDMAEKFYALVVHLFDVPRKESTIENGQITVFCPEEANWRNHPYNNERLRVHYQHDKKMMDFLKHGAWLFWCGDDIKNGRADEIIIDQRITPLIREYARLESQLLNRDLHEPIYAELARAVLHPTAHETPPDASPDMQVDAPESYTPIEHGNNPDLVSVGDLSVDALVSCTSKQLRTKLLAKLASVSL